VISINFNSQNMADFPAYAMRDCSLQRWLELNICLPTPHPSQTSHDWLQAYAFGIAKNHAFIDGNKRTAQVVYRTFIALNGFDHVASQEDKYSAMIQLADGTLSEEDFAEWIRQNIRPA
jgi:hypothetical protein